ncbi:xylitol dehydrogenase [Vararia minispora EC-137]|uniref:Xylitol dehydrogenase n=1 Tax=Vararia minispora EC-137 TaxID=1314806 RepID=A0ACB8QXW9_9AGAM|nr:xylitol dehydrogenase [Vararia minispora EC-137]
MTANPSFVLRAAEKVVFEERPIPQVGDHDVLVEIKKTGICGSDVHFLLDGRIGDEWVVDKPMILGHESAGVINKVGKKVKNVKLGDRVAVEPGRACGVCEDCLGARIITSKLCPEMLLAACPPFDSGTLTRYFSIPSSMVYPLAPHMTLEDGAMMEPLSVAVHAVHKLAAFRAQQSIAVFGCGPVGILCMAVAKALGSRRIVAVDILDERLTFAKSYAGAETFKPPRAQDGDEKTEAYARSAAALKKELGIESRGPNSIDVVLDASGAEASIYTGLLIVKTGGLFVQVGLGHPDITIPMGILMSKEVAVLPSFRYGPGDYSVSLGLASSGKVDVKPLVSHRFKFEDAVNAFEVARKGHSEDGKSTMKVIISGPGVAIDDV